MDHHAHAKRGGNRVHRDIVVRGADAAGGEEIIVAFAQRVHRLNDPVFLVRYDAHLGQADALHLQPFGHLRDILVVRAAGQDFVADNDERGGPDTIGHGKRARVLRLGCARCWKVPVPHDRPARGSRP